MEVEFLGLSAKTSKWNVSLPILLSLYITV